LIHFEDDGKDEEILVLMNVKFMKSKTKEDKAKPHNVDCLVVNFTKQYIMPIEVKATLNQQSYDKAKKRLNECFDLLKDWLSGEFDKYLGHLMQSWKLIPAIFFESKGANCDEILTCADCSYIIQRSEMYKQMATMFNEIKPNSEQDPDEKAWVKFRHIAHCLLFLMPHDHVLTPTKISELESERDKTDNNFGMRQRNVD
jgi:hypothetical protein